MSISYLRLLVRARVLRQLDAKVELATHTGRGRHFQDALFSISNRRLSLMIGQNRGRWPEEHYASKIAHLEQLTMQLHGQTSTTSTRVQRIRMSHDGSTESAPMHDVTSRQIANATNPTPSVDRDSKDSSTGATTHGCRTQLTRLHYHLRLQWKTIPKVNAALNPRASEFTKQVALGSLAHRQKNLANAWIRGQLSVRQMEIEVDTLAGLKKRLHGWDDTRTEAARASIESFIRDANRIPGRWDVHPLDATKHPRSPSVSSDFHSLSVLDRSATESGEFGVTRL